MEKVKRIINAITPPILINLFRFIRSEQKKPDIKPSSGWVGNYSTWQDAKAICTGYENDAILEKCKNSLLKVKNGEAAYERDSFVFDKIQYSWGLLAGLQKASIENKGILNVLDFGGSLGSTYFQNKAFLKGLDFLTWNIVEQEHFINCGKEFFQNEELRFYQSIESCFQENEINVILLSSVLQYLENPKELIDKIIRLKVDYIIVDRTAFIDGPDQIAVQNVPEYIYKASYPCWFFNEKLFLDQFTTNYNVLTDFDNGFTAPQCIGNGKKAYWKGMIFNCKK